jgi:hypothetical protein
MNIATPIVAPERAELESCIPAYRAEFRRKLANHGMSVEVIPRADFLRHHDRCDYPPFRGWTAGQGRILWGVFVRGNLIATWAALAYMLKPGETLRDLLEVRGLYPTEDEAWWLDGDAGRFAERVDDIAVFEGGLCIPREWRKTREAEIVVREMPLYARASAVLQWQCPWVWFLVKADKKLGQRFGAEHLLDSVVWTAGGGLKDGVKRKLGLSSAPWIEAQAAAWLDRRPSRS